MGWRKMFPSRPCVSEWTSGSRSSKNSQKWFKIFKNTSTSEMIKDCWSLKFFLRLKNMFLWHSNNSLHFFVSLVLSHKWFNEIVFSLKLQRFLWRKFSRKIFLLSLNFFRQYLLTQFCSSQVDLCSPFNEVDLSYTRNPESCGFSWLSTI